MPLPLLMSMWRHLPRLRAEESLRRVTEYAIGSGAAKKRERDRVLRQWEVLAAGDDDPTESRPRLSMGWLAGMGVAVETVPVRSEQPEAEAHEAPGDGVRKDKEGRKGEDIAGGFVHAGTVARVQPERGQSHA